MEFEKEKKWTCENTLISDCLSIRCLLVWKWNNESSIVSDHIQNNRDQLKEEKQIDILFSGSYDNSIRIWNLSNGDCLNIWNNAHNSVVSCLKQWNTWLISGSLYQTIRIWKIDEKTLNINHSTQTQQGNCIYTLTQHTGWIYGLEIWNNSLVSVSIDKSICIWKQQLNSDGSNLICPQQIVCDTPIYCVKLWTDCIVTGYGYGESNYSIGIWKKKSNGDTIHLINRFIGHTNIVWCLEVWNENNNQLVSGSLDKTIRLWNSNGKCLSILHGHTNGISSIIIWSGVLFSGSYDDTIKAWNSNGSCLTTLTDHKNAVNYLTIYKDKLISVSTDTSIKLWKQVMEK